MRRPMIGSGSRGGTTLDEDLFHERAVRLKTCTRSDPRSQTYTKPSGGIGTVNWTAELLIVGEGWGL